MKKKLVTKVTGILVVALFIGAFYGCASNTNVPKEEVKPPKQPVKQEKFDETAAIIKATDAYLSGDPKPFMKAEEVYEGIVLKKDDSYQIVDVRASEHYALGHIEGAINIPFKKIVDEEQLAKINPQKKIIVVCYTGHQSSYAAMLLNQLGFDAKAMTFGMTGWTKDKSVYGLEEKKIPTGKGADYPTVSEETTADAAYDLPSMDTGGKDLRDALIKRTQAYFNEGRPFTTAAAFVYDVVQSKNPNYQIVSLQEPEHYAYAHIPGAINISRNAFAREENLKKLDPKKTIIVYCYTGHNGSLISMFLNQLGYKAITLGGGISSWSNDEKVRAKPAYNPAKVPDYPVVKGGQ